MKLLLVRHGRPADRESFASSGHGDDLRPLSPEGRRDMRRIARGIAAAIGAVDLLASSPLARAVETAALLSRELNSVQPAELAALAPRGEQSAILRWLARQTVQSTVALVGHEPALGRLAVHLLGGRGEFIRLKHGGACLLRFPGKAEPRKATLCWLLTARQLRRIGR
jgi:phosphohistidine phosphatase